MKTVSVLLLLLFLLFSTILLGYQAKMVRIGIIGALSDTHFCILSRDCFNLSREYFSLWAIKTSLDRNASAVLDSEVLFSRVARHLACLAFCKLQVDLCYSLIESLSFTCLKAAANLHCQRISANAIFYCYKSIVCRLH